MKQLREIVRKPRFFEAHRMGLFSPRSLDIDVILDLMIHDLDIICLLAPSPVASVHAVGIAILTNRIDIANARVHFEDGCVANITASRVSMEKIRKLRLFQKQEYLSLDYTRQDICGFQPEPQDRRHAGNPEQETDARKKRTAPAGASAFLRATQGLGPVECSGEDGRKALGPGASDTCPG